MADLNNTIQTIEHCVNGGYCNRCKLRDERRCDSITSCKTLLTDALELLKEQQGISVDAFQQWCNESNRMGDATRKGIEYWINEFKAF